MLWKKLEEWADTVYGFVRGLGLQESVMTVDELSSGEEVAGTGEHLQVVFPLEGGGVRSCSACGTYLYVAGLTEP